MLKNSEAMAQFARTGDLDGLRALVDAEGNNCDIDQKVLGCTPLHYAVFYDQLPVVSYLVAMGADLNEKDLSGRTVLMWAVERENIALVKYMLGVEALADQKDNTGATALHRAVLKKNLPLVKLLVEMGKAHVNVKTKDEAGGNTPLHEAASQGNAELLEYLLSHGAEPGVRNHAGRSALHIACFKNHLDCVRALMAHTHCDINQTDGTGRSALHWCAFYGHAGLAAALLDKGASTHHRDKTGATPLDICKRRNFPAIVQVLEGHVTEPRTPRPPSHS
jgi:ankyrin repeat protein